jgi:hypothetical protein
MWMTLLNRGHTVVAMSVEPYEESSNPAVMSAAEALQPSSDGAATNGKADQASLL